ncbi:MAG: WxcM-like domain-containing protein [Candidatus Kapaibacterium sp.]|nr:MAG: WxcM-like domain-containing protein [Candidatus Kapabacteria bacterium]
MTTIHHCSIISLPKLGEDMRGSLSFVESASTGSTENGRGVLPFDIKRAYYLYDVPGGAERGGHAHKDLQQLIVALSGSFQVVLDDGRDKTTITLDRPYNGLYVPTMIWRELVGFSSGAVLFVLASNFYSEQDYYRNYDDFLQNKRLDA